MTRPEWDCTWECPTEEEIRALDLVDFLSTEEEVARRATGGDGRAASVGHAIVAGLAWVAVRGWRFATWWVRVERTEKEER